jgi:hypothetical protein
MGTSVGTDCRHNLATPTDGRLDLSVKAHRQGRRERMLREGNRAAWREKVQAWLLLMTLNPGLPGMKIRDDDLGARFGRQKWLGEDGVGRLSQASDNLPALC